MLQKFFCIAFFLFTSIGLFSQENTTLTESEKAPLSIYTEGSFHNKFNGNLNFSPSSLNSKNFKFMIVDRESFRDDIFKFDLRNIGRRSANFSSLLYKDVDLYKHFPRIPNINDIIRLNESLQEN